MAASRSWTWIVAMLSAWIMGMHLASASNARPGLCPAPGVDRRSAVPAPAAGLRGEPARRAFHVAGDGLADRDGARDELEEEDGSVDRDRDRSRGEAQPVERALDGGIHGDGRGAGGHRLLDGEPEPQGGR